jgi:hypothetical protein
VIAAIEKLNGAVFRVDFQEDALRGHNERIIDIFNIPGHGRPVTVDNQTLCRFDSAARGMCYMYGARIANLNLHGAGPEMYQQTIGRVIIAKIGTREKEKNDRYDGEDLMFCHCIPRFRAKVEEN